MLPFSLKLRTKSINNSVKFQYASMPDSITFVIITKFSEKPRLVPIMGSILPDDPYDVVRVVDVRHHSANCLR